MQVLNKFQLFGEIYPYFKWENGYILVERTTKEGKKWVKCLKQTSELTEFEVKALVLSTKLFDTLLEIKRAATAIAKNQALYRMLRLFETSFFRVE